jgi:2-methylcitrate dehydratase PrpD
MPTAAESLAQFTSGLRAEAIPADVIEAARLHLLDTLGCGLAAHAMEEVSFVQEAAREVATSGPATVIGMPDGLPAGEAALVNGTLSHGLDYDDTHPGSVIHVSAGVVAAALAAAEVHDAPASALLAALVAGNETSIRVGLAARGAFHARGFHPTGVCGVFGATAAASLLRGLDERRTVHALGIAGSMASGLMEFLADGAKTKPLHPGWAAQAGLTAARLAAHGGTGPSSVLDGDRGFLAAYLHGHDWDIASEVADLGERWATPEIAFKPYSACHYNHAPLDALQQLIDDEGLRAEDVASITAVSDETGSKLVLEPLAFKVAPRTPYDAKFSAPYCLAALLVHGRVGVDSFGAAAIADPRVLELAGRIDGEIKRYAAAPDAFPGGVRVRTTDGRLLESELRHQRGGSAFPMATGEVIGKYRENASLALEADAVERLEEAVLDLGRRRDLTWLATLGQARVAELAV